MMILAIKLSNSVPISAGNPGRRCVSTRTPCPAGKRYDLILPTERDQLFDTSSAVRRSWIECSGGGCAGLFDRLEGISFSKGSP